MGDEGSPVQYQRSSSHGHFEVFSNDDGHDKRLLASPGGLAEAISPSPQGASTASRTLEDLEAKSRSMSKASCSSRGQSSSSSVPLCSQRSGTPQTFRSGTGTRASIFRRLRVAAADAEDEEPPSLEGKDLSLWLAAARGDADEVERALKDGADPTCVMPQNDERAIKYKGRKLSCQPLHAAAAVLERSVVARLSSSSRMLRSQSGRLSAGSGSSPGCAMGREVSLWSLEDSGKSADESDPEGSPTTRQPLLKQVQQQARANLAGVVELLLDAKADVNSFATAAAGGCVRKMQAVHIASGSGNVSVLEVLLDRGADANAEALIDATAHYYPIHDAAFMNRMGALEILLHHHACITHRNVNGESALHLAAGLGYVGMVEALVSHSQLHSTAGPGKNKLISMKCNKGELALSRAVASGSFPSSKLPLFTQDMNTRQRVEAFVLVAKECPSAASTLLKDGREDAMAREAGLRTEIAPEWRRSLIEGANQGMVTVDTLTELIEYGPEAALYLLEALAEEPNVADRQHNPLPVRAKLPEGYEPVQLTCAYTEDELWKWSPEEGVPHWQRTLATTDARLGVEVKTQVVRLRGIITMQILFALAVTPDRRVFAKLAVHALLKHAWSKLHWIFTLETAHEVGATLALSVWILSKEPPSYWVKFALWACTASRGITACLLVVVMLVRISTEMGQPAARRWLLLVLFRLSTGACTTLLCAQLLPDLWPHRGNDMESTLLAVNSLLHWTFLLLQMRALPAVGQKLLPILKSVQTITPMILIVVFLMLAFVHGFWAFDMDRADDVRFFEVASMLFTGENIFIQREELGSMDSNARVLHMLLAMLGMFLFLACALNVFIAVLGDRFDLEQERMSCTFLQERARICCGCCLGTKLSRRWCLLAALLAASACAAGAALLGRPLVGAWLVAGGLAALLVVLKGWLHTRIMADWSDKHLWLCHRTSVDESQFLTEDADEGVDSAGRITRIKHHLHHRVQDIEHKIDELSKTQSSMADSQREITDALKDLTQKLQEMGTQQSCTKRSVEEIGKVIKSAAVRRRGASHTSSSAALARGSAKLDAKVQFAEGGPEEIS